MVSCGWEFMVEMLSRLNVKDLQIVYQRRGHKWNQRTNLLHGPVTA